MIDDFFSAWNCQWVQWIAFLNFSNINMEIYEFMVSIFIVDGGLGITGMHKFDG